MCQNSVEHFIDNWAWTFDPRRQVAHLPFTLYPFQKEALKWIDDRYYEGEVGVIEKTRDMGVTWLACAWTVHKWIFDKGFTALFGSKTEGDVDSSTVDSIFGKVRYILRRLPPFLCPDLDEKINEKRHADSYLSIINPTNGNEITGDSANSNFGRSGRRSIVFMDEYAFVENSDKIWSAISEVSNCIIPMSTANGKGNMFYNLRAKGTVPVLTLHWTKHPLKNQDWYDSKKKTMEPHQIAQELDIDYSSSKAGRVYKRFNRQFHVSTEIIYPNPILEQFVTWDFGIADSMCVTFGQIDATSGVEIYACYDLTDQDIEYFMPIARGEIPGNNLWHLLPEYEQLRVKRVIKKAFYNHITGERLDDVRRDHYGDHAGSQRTANSRRSVRERMKTEGQIDLICTSKQDFPTRIQSFDNLLKLRETSRGMQTRFKISPDCEPVIDAIMNYVWDKEDVNNPNIKPKHDWASHYVSSLEFFAINRFPIRAQSKVSVERVR
jgi:hypothetical protein